MMNESIGTSWGAPRGTSSQLPTTLRVVCFSGRVCVCVCVCVSVSVCLSSGEKRRLARGWVEILSCSLPVMDDLREWVPP